MAFQLQDRVQETTTTTGTGALTLAGAMTGFRSFSSVCANADTFYYGLQAVTGAGTPSGNWEIGIGTYNASGNTLSRTTVLASSNGGSVVNLAAGTTQVWIDLPAALPANLPVSAKYFGAKGNTRIVNDGVTTSGSTAISSASAAFTAADVGKRIDIATTNASGVATLVVSTTIAAFVSATQVTLAKAAGASATAANVVYGSDDGPALTAWLNYLMTIWPVKGDLPAGVYFSGTALPAITKPIALFGHSARTSIIQFGAGVSGQCLTVLNAGFNNEVTDLPQTGNVSWTSNTAVLAGCVLRDFTLQGNRACTSLQHGLVLQGNVDWLDVAHVNCLYFRGGGVLWMDTGSGSTQARANVREVNLDTMKIRHCGDVSTNTPSLGIYLDDSPAAAGSDSSNLFNLNNIDIIFSYGTAFAVQDRRTSNTGFPLYGIQARNIVLHDRMTTMGLSGGRMFSVIGQVTNCLFDINFPLSARNDYAAEILPNPNFNVYPTDNEFTFAFPKTVKGVIVGNVGYNTIRFRNYFGCAEAVFIATESPYNLRIDCETDSVFQQITTALVLTGTGAVAIPGWSFGTTPNLSIFMPVNAVNGTGDTTLATIFGITGTITRSGSVTAGTDSYTFTPSSSNTSYIPAGEYFSKICVDASQGNGVAGRYKYIPEDRYGRAVNSAWASGRLLQMWPWQFHIENATGLVRYSYGVPTADSAGNAIAVWANGFVGTSLTPSVTGISKLTANYALPTTLTNLVGGIDGQSIKIVATNGNCTIANNANIQTATGANVVMATGQVLTLTFDATLNKWCSG
ncbi:hypothetical protein [Burkholderia cepacia]|uniref:hypothetical protein n=1 Tax=Burkholderia cepacia TaxID=292 RepID=UPI0015927540|nr:hypothetical protein [Burkholderia cepacia]